MREWLTASRYISTLHWFRRNLNQTRKGVKQKMQDVNNKLHDLLEGLTSFFEHYCDQSADLLAALQEVQKKQDTIIELLRTIAAK